MLLCIIAFGTRMYQRIRPVWKVGLDDCFIVAGFVSLPALQPGVLSRVCVWDYLKPP